MEKQRVCIIGGGLSGLVTATALGKLNLNIDLFANDFYVHYKSLKTTAISHSNYIYLKNLNIFNSYTKEFWPCTKMELYDADRDLKNHKIFDFDKYDKTKNILYMISNNTIVQIMKKKIKKNKNIKIKSNTSVKKLFSHQGLKFVETNDKTIHKYNLIILCTGKNSFLTKMFLGKSYFDYSYNETSVATIINHAYMQNKIARQFFLKEGPLALLPISNFKTSIIWSLKNDILYNKEKNKELFIKKNLENLIKNIYKNIKFSHNFEYNDLSFHFSHKCYSDRVLIFGDALHSIHPFVGQGFNMTLRDLIKLEKIVKKEINLGLDVGNSSILHEFIDETKPNNLIYSAGIGIIKKIFTNNNSTLQNLKSYYLGKLNNNKNVKTFFTRLADKGINL